MVARNRPSKVDQLPAEIRELIAKLRRNNCTTDQIMGKLAELDLGGMGVKSEDLPSRSGLARHLKQVDAVTAEMRRQQTLAEAMVERGLVMDQGQTAKLNVALAHGLLTRLMFTEEGQVATLDPEEAMFVARSIQSLASAAKADTDRELKVRSEMAKEAAAAAKKVATGMGLTREAVEAFQREMLGLAK